jgi:2-amino-4-hydroxy-6-hydroxymethyldihydropteridine diphosphokinase
VFSRAYRNVAVGFDGPDFINLVMGFTTPQPLEAVIARLHAIETQCGRPRFAPKWASRTMDLDVLLFGDRVEKTADYTLPRPDLLKRPYMLGPMAEIAPEVVHPTANKTIGQLWEEFDRGGHAMNPVVLPEMVPGTVI